MAGRECRIPPSHSPVNYLLHGGSHISLQIWFNPVNESPALLCLKYTGEKGHLEKRPPLHPLPTISTLGAFQLFPAWGEPVCLTSPPAGRYCLPSSPSPGGIKTAFKSATGRPHLTAPLPCSQRNCFSEAAVANQSRGRKGEGCRGG